MGVMALVRGVCATSYRKVSGKNINEEEEVDMMRVVWGLLLWGLTQIAWAQETANVLVPSDHHSALYYRLGGGRDFAFPAVKNRERINLKGRSELGTGYHCGMFDPQVSLRDTFNQLYRSYENVKNQLAQNMTSMVGHAPFYLLARANPTLYHLLTGQLLEAGTTIDVATKHCRQLLHETEQGRNPYTDWGHVAIGDAWKTQLQLGESNIVKAHEQVEHQAYRRGVPWVQGAMQVASGQALAGGEGQPPIHVVRDSVIAGYNILLQRALDDRSAPKPTADNAYLIEHWSTPLAAADWVVDVLGDVIVTTCVDAACDKSSQAGRGLLPLIHVCQADGQTPCAERLAKRLLAMVQGQAPVSKENLLALSSSAHVMTPQVIQSLQQLDDIDRVIVVDKLAQEITALDVLDRAQLARRLLMAGSQAPVILANAAAFGQIQQVLTRLNDEVGQLAFETRLKRELAAQTLLSVLQQYDTQKAQTLVQPDRSDDNTPLMRRGASFKAAGAP
jgi:integrating conjugative element protein (TIGR03755 family)